MSLEEWAVFIAQKLVVVDAGYGFFRAKALCHGTRGDVARLKGRNGNIQVGTPHLCIAQSGKRCGAARVSEQVVIVEIHEFALIAVDNDDVLVLLRKEFRQVRTHFTCSCYYDFHLSELRSSLILAVMLSASMPQSFRS